MQTTAFCSVSSRTPRNTACVDSPVSSTALRAPAGRPRHDQAGTLFEAPCRSTNRDHPIAADWKWAECDDQFAVVDDEVAERA
jgi:hypothetical protein